jgi:hypothetical protein
MSVEGMAGLMAHMDCQPDASTQDHEHFGTDCPDGMSCQPGVSALPSLTMVPLTVRMASPTPPDVQLLFVTRTLLPLWRPPALI